MNKKFNIISFVLIVILIIVLIMVIFNYFTRENVVNIVNQNSYPASTDITHIIPSGSNNTGAHNDNIVAPSGENISGSGDIYVEVEGNKSRSGDIKNEVDNKENNSNDVKQIGIPSDNNLTSVIISSNDEISNKDKKQVLKELDQTLMELLDVVDKVQTVDESRLTNEESEGQKWKNYCFYLY